MIVKNLKIELHLLQNFPPSCLNRDGTNTPKTCEFGGVTRARVSSQCWKYAVRKQFRLDAPERAGIRSKGLVEELCKRLAKENAGTPDIVREAVLKFVSENYAKMDAKSEKAVVKDPELFEQTNVLIFWSPAEFDTMTAILRETLAGNAPTANEVRKRIKASTLSTDVALFARMLADSPDLKVEGSCQVAHAISTHQVNLELDFYTAVNDLNKDDETGAGMLGTIGYDSACYYRYALVDDVQLVENLHGSTTDADVSIKAFLETFCDVIPGAKRNSFAPGNPPFYVFFVVRQAGTPASLVNAFAKPVKPYTQIGGKMTGDLLTESALAFAAQVDNFKTRYELYEGAVTQCYHFKGDAALPALHGTESLTIREAIAGVMATVKAFREQQNAAEAQQ